MSKRAGHIMHPASHEAEIKVRTVTLLLVAFSLSVVLIALNLMLSFSRDVATMLTVISQMPVLRILVNVLCAWLVVSLCVVFMKWRVVVAKQAEMEAVLSSISPDVLLVIAPDRRIRMCNFSVMRVFGYRPEEILGKTTDILYGDRRADRNRPREIHDTLEKKGFHYGLASGLRKDGTPVPLEIITGELIGRGGAVLLIRDVTERMEMEARRRELEERAQRAERLQSLGLLAGGIAHDFNNLLTLIQGHADLILLRNQLSEDVKEGVNGILKGSMRAHELCQNLMSFAGRRKGEPDQIAFGDIVEETVKLLQPRTQNHLRLALTVRPELPVLAGDVTQLRQVAMNILSNAVDAMRGKSGGVIHIDVRYEGLNPELISHCLLAPETIEGPYVQMVVRDEGCGMSEAIRVKVCEPFYSAKSGGHGMGMAAVAGILRSHHGGIAIESVEGQGTAVTIFLPLESSATA